jgi:F-type H+-transporting ATPase subunit b
MSLVTPAIGLIFWMTIAFGIAWFVLGKFAWKPILAAIKEREQGITNALQAAEKAKNEMANLKADNEKLLVEARIQRDKMMIEATEAKNNIISEAKTQASEEAKRLLAEAKLSINNERMAAITDIKNTAGNLAIEIAEKILSNQLSNRPEQDAYIKQHLADIRLN